MKGKFIYEIKYSVGNQINHRQMSTGQRTQRGRPKNSSQQEPARPDRDEKPEEIKQFWTEHRITLIAYEAQYIYNKKAPSKDSEIQKSEKQIMINAEEKKSTQQKQKKRKGRKKADPQFQTGFLFSMGKQEPSEDIKVQQLAKTYQNLGVLFSQTNQDVDDIEVRQFMKIMLELKNEEILHEFLPLYNLIYKEISAVQFEKVEKEKDRTQFLKGVESKLHALITSSAQGKFKKFKQYLRNDLKQTLKLLYVESYCFLAEKFNFNINQFYAQAFSITLQHNKTGNKKVKGE